MSDDDIYAELQKPRHQQIFEDIYSDGTYDNAYVRREFYFWPQYLEDGVSRPVLKDEYVFTCLLKQADDYVMSDEDFTEFAGMVADDDYYPSDDNSYIEPGSVDAEENTDDELIIVPFWVTKGYDLHRGLHAHRYIIPVWHTSVMLAEEPAAVYSRPDFNVELHYLELKKHHTFGKNHNDQSSPATSGFLKIYVPDLMNRILILRSVILGRGSCVQIEHRIR